MILEAEITKSIIMQNLMNLITVKSNSLKIGRESMSLIPSDALIFIDIRNDVVDIV